MNIFKRKKKIIIIFLAFVFLISGLAFYHTRKALPAGVDYLSNAYYTADENVSFLYDLSFKNEAGEVVREQRIFDEVFKRIDEAEKYILIDMFLYNDYGAKSDEAYRRLADELTDKLAAKKENNQDIAIDLITDPINVVYGGSRSRHLEKLKNAGVNVIVSDLDPLRDSNFLYSPFWRVFFKLLGNTETGWIKHPFSGSEPDVSLRSYLKLLNFKANHRKIFTADAGEDMVSIVMSANPHNGSSAHSNAAFLVVGDFAETIYATESGVAGMSGRALSGFPEIKKEEQNIGEGAVVLRLATEKKIKDILLEEIGRAGPSSAINIAQFYLSDRDIISGLINASARGAEIKIVLDPNKDAFGYKKNGIPNRQATRELLKKSSGKIAIRWYDTHGEQFHTKIFIHEDGDRLQLVVGSANLTRRNLENYNLELNIYADMPPESATGNDVKNYFSRIWYNTGGQYTVAYENYQDDSKLKYLIYRIQEAFGLSSF
jgi:phosphatidylserine/phosphatidylglycerophosphate/cardiolipin synthase-like enzyme